jgi:hypothetical protein
MSHQEIAKVVHIKLGKYNRARTGSEIAKRALFEQAIYSWAKKIRLNASTWGFPLGYIQHFDDIAPTYSKRNAPTAEADFARVVDQEAREPVNELLLNVAVRPARVGIDFPEACLFTDANDRAAFLVINYNWNLPDKVAKQVEIVTQALCDIIPFVLRPETGVPGGKRPMLVQREKMAANVTIPALGSTIVSRPTLPTFRSGASLSRQFHHTLLTSSPFTQYNFDLAREPGVCRTMCDLIRRQSGLSLERISQVIGKSKATGCRRCKDGWHHPDECELAKWERLFRDVSPRIREHAFDFHTLNLTAVWDGGSTRTAPEELFRYEERSRVMLRSSVGCSEGGDKELGRTVDLRAWTTSISSRASGSLLWSGPSRNPAFCIIVDNGKGEVSSWWKTVVDEIVSHVQPNLPK